MAIGQITVPYFRGCGYNFGVGVDLATGSRMGKVVDGAASVVEDAEGATVEFRVERIQSTEELEQALGIQAEANYGCGAFGAGASASARFSFAKKAKIQSSSLFMLVTIQLELASLSIDDPGLSKDAADLSDQPDVFKDRYGNMFVSGMGRGGLFVGTLRVETGSSEESENIASELKGTYGLFSAEARTNFDKVQKMHRASTFIDMYHEGGPVDLRIDDFTNPLELLGSANRFLESFKTDPGSVAKPYYVTLSPTTIARGPLPLNAADLEHAQDVLVACAKARSRLLDKLNLLDYILDNSGKYDFGADSAKNQKAINDAVKLYQTDVDLIADCATNAIRSPSKALMPTDFAEKQVPVKTYPKGILPDPLPLPKAGKIVAVPDFSSCRSWIACNETATRAGLVAQQQFTDSISLNPEGFKVVSVTPPVATPVSEGTVLTIVTQRVQIFFPNFFK